MQLSIPIFTQKDWHNVTRLLLSQHYSWFKNDTHEHDEIFDLRKDKAPLYINFNPEPEKRTDYELTWGMRRKYQKLSQNELTKMFPILTTDKVRPTLEELIKHTQTDTTILALFQSDDAWLVLTSTTSVDLVHHRTQFSNAFINGTNVTYLNGVAFNDAFLRGDVEVVKAFRYGLTKIYVHHKTLSWLNSPLRTRQLLSSNSKDRLDVTPYLAKLLIL